MIREITGSGRNHRVELIHCRPGETCFQPGFNPTHGSIVDLDDDTASNYMDCRGDDPALNDGDACFYTFYNHLSAGPPSPLVLNSFVDQGTQIGRVGCNQTAKCKRELQCANGDLCYGPKDSCSDNSTCTPSDTSGSFPHLHFEVRDQAHAGTESTYYADTIQPLSFLTYSHLTSAAIDVLSATQNAGGTFEVQGTVTYTAANNALQKVDLAAVSVEVKRFLGYKCFSGIIGYICIPQFEDIAQPNNTPNADGYLVKPSVFDIVEWNGMVLTSRSTS